MSDLYKNIPVRFAYRGKVHELIAQIKILPDQLDDSFLSESQVEAVQSGGCDVVTVLVEVSLGDVTGGDSLGQVFVYSSEDIDQTISEHHMIKEALTDLEARLDAQLSLIGGVS